MGAGRPVDPARRGRSIVTLAVVSGSTGAFLLLGGSFAGGLRHWAGVPLEVLFVLVLAAAVAGVWVGAWLSVRLTGGDAARFRATGIGGTVGLVVAIALGYLSTKFLPGILPLLAILSPGASATIAGNASDPSRRPRRAAEPDAGAAETETL
ncbi:MAG TPA: hypothetical protein VGA71_01170 [Actinomycetota bacterium]